MLLVMRELITAQLNVVLGFQKHLFLSVINNKILLNYFYTTGGNNSVKTLTLPKAYTTWYVPFKCLNATSSTASATYRTMGAKKASLSTIQSLIPDNIEVYFFTIGY